MELIVKDDQVLQHLSIPERDGQTKANKPTRTQTRENVNMLFQYYYLSRRISINVNMLQCSISSMLQTGCVSCWQRDEANNS
jgi:ABC-type phosphate/phosphonate transport system ATPase subunit